MTGKKGNVHLIFGPMYAGKTTELIRLKKRAEIAGLKCIVIKYYKDIRYDDHKISTHEKRKIDALVSDGPSLAKTIEKIADLHTYHCIFIDEIQFYDDAPDICDQLANQGHQVIVCGLQGDFERKPFDVISRLIPMAENFTHLKAIDEKTGGDAAFTARLTSEKQQHIIGGKEMYISVDRSHYHELNK